MKVLCPSWSHRAVAFLLMAGTVTAAAPVNDSFANRITVSPSGPALPPSSRLMGMTASPHDIHEFQPDGTPIVLNIRGGVEFHWLEDSAGYTVVQDGKAFVYAQLNEAGRLAPTAWLVGKANPGVAGLLPRTLPNLEIRQQLLAERMAGAAAASPPAAVPPLGTVKNVVILMRFANHTGRTLPSNANMNTIFNAVGGDPALAPTGSVRDLYLENSYGAMVLNSTVYGWVTLPQTEQYYANGNRGLDSTVWQAITSALNLTDSLIDYNQFDGDGDDWVDAISFIHSGYGAEWGGTDADGVNYTNRIWSHRWQIPTWTSAEGVRVSDYHISPGLWSTTGTAPGRIGVICHETGHFFGLPDLYDIDGGGEGIGSYCMMANSWGFNFTQLNPPHFSAWSKTFLGWMTPTLLNAPGNYSLARAETSPTAFKITNGYPSGEYLLVENRQPFGFESIMPQGGLVIWHIDGNKSDNTDEGFPGQAGWPSNNQHYKVALLQADGLFNLEHGNNRGDAGDVYHGAGVSEISHSTTPNTDAYQNGTLLNTGNRIFAISGAGSTMTFSYANALVTLGLTGSSMAEAGGVATVTATLSAVSGQAVTVNLGVSGTATLASDYTRSGTIITIPAGSLSGSITLTAVQDTLDELNETVVVDITTVVNGTESGIQQVTATITDDDAAPTVILGLTGSPMAENGGVATVTATLSAVSGQAVTVNLAVSGTATLTSDYTQSATSIVIPGGSLSGSITLTGVQDTLDEANETVVVDITTVVNGTESGTQQLTATITDDDPAPTVTLSLTSSPMAEGGGAATVTATLSALSGRSVTVDLTFSGTATLTSDYTRSGTSIIISAGSPSGLITLTAVQDTLVELNETVVVDISTVGNGTENGTQQVTATITDDDPPPAPRLLSIVESPVGNFILAWQVSPGRTYRFDSKDSLTDPTWTPLATNTPTTSSATITNNAGTNRHGFNRVVDVTGP